MNHKITLGVLIICLFFSLIANAVQYIIFSNQKKELQLSNQNLSLMYTQTKSDLDKVYQLGEAQADVNDQLILNQENLIGSVNNFLSEMDQTFRFVNRTPQFLPSLDQDDIVVSRRQVEESIQDLDQTTSQNFDRKQEFIDGTDQIYQKNNQDKPNRANPDAR